MTRHSLVPLLAQLADAGTVFVAAILAFYLRFDAAVPVVPQQYHAYLFCILAGVLLNAFLATALGAYRNWRGAGLGDVLTPLLLAWGATALTLVVLLFALKTSEVFSRLWFGSWVLLAAVLLALERLVLLRVLRYLRARGVNRKRVVLVGFSEQIPELLQRLKKADWAGYEVVALFLPQGKDAAAVSGVPVRRDLAALDSFVREHEVMEVWLTCPLREEAFLQEVLWLLRHSTVNIRYLPDLFALRLFPGVEDFGIVPLEAMASGTPVIAFGKGGALETVIESSDPSVATGLFFHEQSVAAIEEAVARFESLPVAVSAEACRRQAERFAPARFREQISSFIDAKLLERRSSAPL